MKRSLTTEILSQLHRAPSMASVGSPVKQEDANPEKRMRRSCFDGEKRAALLLTARPMATFDLEEFFGAINMKKDVSDTLQTHVLNIKRAMDNYSGRLGRKSELAAMAVGVLKLMGDAREKIEGKEKEPSIPQTVMEAELALAESGTDNERKIQLHSQVCRVCVNALSELRKCQNQVEQILNETGNEADSQILAAQKAAVVAASDVTGKQQVVEENRTKLRAMDDCILKAITQTQSAAVAQGAALSVLLDAVLQPEPSMAKMLEDRRLLGVSLKQAENDHTNAEQYLSLATAVVKLLMWSVESITKHAKPSLSRGATHRTNVKRVLARTLMRHIPELFQSLAAFASFQQERIASADNRLTAKQDELGEHLRLYADEAPSELKEIKKRLAEYQSIKERSGERLARMGREQSQLWSEALASPDAGRSVDGGVDAAHLKEFRKAPLDSERAILPADVVVRLQRCIDELMQSIKGPENELRKSMREILASAAHAAPSQFAVVTAPALDYEMMPESATTTEQSLSIVERPRASGTCPEKRSSNSSQRRYPLLHDLEGDSDSEEAADDSQGRCVVM